MTYAMYATARYVVVLCFFYLFLKVPEIGRFSVVMYISNQFIDGKLFSFSLAGLAGSRYKTWGFVWARLKNDNTTT